MVNKKQQNFGKKKKVVINFVTGNAGKVKTMQNHIGKYGFQVVQTRLSLVEPQASSAETVALSKAMQAFRILKQAVVVEDSSFHIDELKGFPGPYIKYMLQTLGANGLVLLGKNLNNKTCRFVGALAYIDSDGVPRTFVQKGDPGTLSAVVDHTSSEEAWSDLWRIFIPFGYKVPLTGLKQKDRDRVWKKWESESVFTQFAQWLHGKNKSVKHIKDSRLKGKT